MNIILEYFFPIAHQAFLMAQWQSLPCKFPTNLGCSSLPDKFEKV